MSEDSTPLQLVHSPAPTAVQAWNEAAAPMPVMPKPPLERVIGALRRYRWLMLGVFLLAVVGGVAAIRIVRPQYEVTATIWIQSETPMGARGGAIHSEELLNAQAWVELFRSYRIADAVVRKLSLYVRPENAADSA